MPKGRPVGRFDFTGRRSSDKNDKIRHQDRRELRGLRIFSSFIGWANINARSTYDTFLETADGRGYLEHWFLNLTEISKPGETPKPAGTGASMQNGAFARMTPRDALWAANLVARFTDPVIDAIIAAAKYTDAHEARKAADDLKMRRSAIEKKWFAMLSPLDDFVLSPENDGVKVTCSDLALNSSQPAPSERLYRAELTTPYGRAIVVPWQESASCAFTLDGEGMKSLDNGRLYELLLESKDAKNRWWLPAVKLLVRAEEKGVALEGIERRGR
jgi:hypothetical protein